MKPLDAVKLYVLMARTKGNPQIKVGLVDVPIVVDHPALAQASIQELLSASVSACAQADSIACIHGTFIIGMLAASRDSEAHTICPDHHLLHRPNFSVLTTTDLQNPSTSPDDLTMVLVGFTSITSHLNFNYKEADLETGSLFNLTNPIAVIPNKTAKISGKSKRREVPG